MSKKYDIEEFKKEAIKRINEHSGFLIHHINNGVMASELMCKVIDYNEDILKAVLEQLEEESKEPEDIPDFRGIL